MRKSGCLGRAAAAAVDTGRGNPGSDPALGSEIIAISQGSDPALGSEIMAISQGSDPALGSEIMAIQVVIRLSALKLWQ
jgi:hypothetical protein